MASPHFVQSYDDDDDNSDYGSEFSPEEEVLVEKLLAVAILKDPPSPPRDIEDIGNFNKNRQNASQARSSKSSRRRSGQSWEESSVLSDEDDSMDIVLATKIEESNLLSDEENLNRNGRNGQDVNETNASFIEELIAANERESEITKTPLERFRNNKYKQALSVTDLVSTSWCELQYFYQMRTGKRKKATPAMKQGTKIHSALEEQVSKPVVVATTTREDGWGLRLWNVIQGLKTLRETGITRELEVWGVIDGVVVNGVIDELSYICPDEDMEYDLQVQQPDYRRPPEGNQKTISEYFQSQSSGNSSLNSATSGSSFSSATRDTSQSEPRDTRRIYITDVKTRSGNSLPSDAAFRPTKMQLMLYHHLLLKLSTNTVDFSLVASRYSLDITAPFSDAFIAEMAGLQDSPSSSSEGNNFAPGIPMESDEDALTILLAHNSLSLLWSLMMSEFQKTFPNGRSSLGNVLQAEYRTPSLVSEGGKVLGSKTFAMSQHVLAVYVEYEMRFWKGERDPVGVMLGEAWKCGSCDFAAACEWRREREEEILGLAKKISLSSGDVSVSRRLFQKTSRVEIEEEVEKMEGMEAENAFGSDKEAEMEESKPNGRRESKKPELTKPSAISSISPKPEEKDTSALATPKRRGRPRKSDSAGVSTKAEASKPKSAPTPKKLTNGTPEVPSDSEWMILQQELMVAEAEADAGGEQEEETRRVGGKKKK